MTTQLKSSEILKKAKELISKPENWTKGAFARTDRGFAVSSSSDAACSFCSVGAINRIQRDLKSMNDDVYGYLERRMNTSIPTFNDNRTHSEVMEAFDKAIQLAESNGD